MVQNLTKIQLTKNLNLKPIDIQIAKTSIFRRIMWKMYNNNNSNNSSVIRKFLIINNNVYKIPLINIKP